MRRLQISIEGRITVLATQSVNETSCGNSDKLIWCFPLRFSFLPILLNAFQRKEVVS